ncbi:MAG: Bcr/CflA family efflux MFS transporter, partial [Pseudomonadota bacterium]
MRADDFPGLGVTSGRLPQPSDAPILLLILISMIQPVAMNMYVPAMAAMRHDLATSPAAIQATLYAFLVATAVGQVVVGPLSDIYGRRTVLLTGLWIFAMGSVICIVAPTIETLILGRIIQGLGGCAGLALSRAIIRDIHGTATSASMIGYVTMGMATAPLVAPAIGGLLYETTSWRVIFAVIGLLGLVGLAAATHRLRETHQSTGGDGVFARWRAEMRELLTLRDFWAYSLTLAALCVAFFSFLGGGSFVAAAVYELSASEYGLYFIFMVSGYVFGNFITGRYS